MKKRLILLFTLVSAMTLTFYSCEDDDNDDEGENETKISSNFETESHKAGDNCMSCHVSGGSGEGWFTVAGTVYNSEKTETYPNASVKLYTGPNGTGELVSTIEVDGRGNFYTTETIDFGAGLYTLVEGDLATKHMASSINNGACNSCHGVSTDKIWVE